jgi:hypothetical protein
MGSDIESIGDSTKKSVDACNSYKYAYEYAKGKDGDYLENYHKGLKEYDRIAEERDKKFNEKKK